MSLNIKQNKIHIHYSTLYAESQPEIESIYYVIRYA